MKKSTILIIGMFFLLVFLVSCSSEKVAEELVVEETPAVNTQTTSAEKEDGCGDGVCESGEAICGVNYKTVCAEDCGLKCPSVLIVNDDAKSIRSQTESYFCSGKCEETSPGVFKVSGIGYISTYLVNIGEKSSAMVYADSNCKRMDGIQYKDYFESNIKSTDTDLDELRFVPSASKGMNYAKRTFKVDVTNVDSPGEVECTLKINSLNMNNIQKVTVVVE